MKTFKQMITEATIDDFMSKIASCQTLDGIKELETYYSKRVKEVQLSHSDDISVRDAIKGRTQELTDANEPEQEEENF
ncbi:split helicase [Pectobacterium phage POP12]|nr:split helicase [Pectobacterium phage POP12]